MTAIGIDRFRRMLRRLSEKADQGRVHWYHDPDEKSYCVQFEQQARISLYHQVPQEEPELAGAVLHIGEELVATLEAEEGEDDWQLLHGLHRAAEDWLGQADSEITSIERELASDDSVGDVPASAESHGGESPPVERSKRPVHTATSGGQLPSLEDLEDGDSPFDEEN